MMDYLLAYLNDEMSLSKALMCVRDDSLKFFKK